MWHTEVLNRQVFKVAAYAADSFKKRKKVTRIMNNCVLILHLQPQISQVSSVPNCSVPFNSDPGFFPQQWCREGITSVLGILGGFSNPNGSVSLCPYAHNYEEGTSKQN